MANDRIYLKCMCNKDDGIYLGKTYSSGYFFNDYLHGDNFFERLNDYYDKHSTCGFDLSSKIGINSNQHYYICYDGDVFNTSLKAFLEHTKDKQINIEYITHKLHDILGFKPYSRQVLNIIDVIKKELGGN